MKAQAIVEQLATRLPQLVDDFTTQFDITSLVQAAGTATATTSAAHGLVVGQAVNIVGAETPIACSITRVGILGTMITDTDHDMTENAGFDVQIEGATETEFNGTFKLNSVPNRRTITFIMDDSGPTVATGAPLLLNGSNPFQSYNGLFSVSAIPTTTTFNYALFDSAVFSPASGSIVAKTAPRISAAVDIEKAVDSYTKQPGNNGWLFVVLGDGIANKNKNIDLDSVNNLQIGQFFDQRMIQPVNLYVILPSSDEIMGRNTRDRAQELLRPICQSILRAKFDSLLSSGSLNPLQITGHGFQGYNGAYYIHRYDFEAVEQFTVDDVFVPDIDVAFRDIDFTLGLNTGNETFETLIDLDDEPV